MSIEWFNRVTLELQEQLNSICEEYEQVGQMKIDRSAKHPRIEFFVNTESDERDYFCILFFDPHNNEFYVEMFDLEFEQQARIMLPDIEDIIDAVHFSLHDYINDDSYLIIDDEDEGIVEVDDNEELNIAKLFVTEEVHENHTVEWETPEMTAFQIAEKVEVTYQFGVENATGKGVLRRVNRKWSEDGELFKGESSFTFSKDEASTIIALIASHMDAMPSNQNL
ncbi:hypothetical protein [Sporosarcina sp. FA9]|uniref:hypothetical protein n=1 Tax=Sporosarcina sp. FA9 TaxID=3413030 RepID=UPI003F65D989